jgi:hypothetical protein
MRGKRPRFGTSYFGNVILRHFRSDLAEMRRQGCSFVVLTFSETDQWHHGDALRDLVVEAKRRGFLVLLDPWAFGGVFGGEALTMLPVWHPEERQIRSDGRAAPALCLNSPVLFDRLKGWIDAVARLGPHFVLWDEPHFYLNWWDRAAGWRPSAGAWSCRCARCRRLFRMETGRPLPTRETREVLEFKRRHVRDFLLRACRYAASKGLRNCLGLLPEEMDSLAVLGRDPSVHMLGGETYFEYPAGRPRDVRAHARERTRSAWQEARACGKPLMMWVMGFRVPRGREGDVRQAIRGCAEGGADLVATWGFDGCRHVSSVSSARPGLVWRTMGATYRKLLKTGRS